MSEHYIWWNYVRRLSWREIQEMRDNMKKVQNIKEKSNAYHKKEVKQLDLLLEKIDEE